ncbi:MAG: extracellular solute-binding protein [Roseburia sp.]|nr:extracellular solute-binding protein [Roseburia sp.]
MKKLMSLILVGTMCLGMFACGTTNNEQQSGSEKDTTVAESSENVADTAATEESTSTLLCDEPTTLIVYGNWSESPTTEDDQMVHDKILELTNVDLVRVGSGDYYNQRATYLSSGEQIDLMLESCWWATDLIAQGAYQDVTDYVEEYAPNFYTMMDPSYHSFVKWDGKYYGIGGTAEMNLYGLWVNKTMLDEAGVAVPETIEDLENVCAKLLEKDPECYPIVANWTWLQREYESSFTEAYVDWYDDETGLLKVDFEMPGYLDFITAVKEWYKSGYLASFCEPGSWDNDKFTTALMTGKCAFVSYNCQGFLDLADQIASQPEYVYVEAFAGDEGQRGFEPRPSIPYFYAVPSSSENAELAIKFLNWAMTEDARRLMNHGIEGVHYNIDDNGYLVKTDAYDNYTKCYNLCNVFLSELEEEPATDNAKVTEELLAEYGMNTYFGKNDAYGVNMNLASIPQDIRDKQASDKTAVTEIIAKYMWTDEVDLAAVEKAIADYSENNSEYTKLRTEIYKNCLELLGVTTDDIRAGLEKK